MLPLAVNSVTSQSMRPKYALAVGALPIALMFAFFVPLARFATWLEGALSIPHNAPIRDQPNGTLLARRISGGHGARNDRRLCAWVDPECMHRAVHVPMAGEPGRSGLPEVRRASSLAEGW